MKHKPYLLFIVLLAILLAGCKSNKIPCETPVYYTVAEAQLQINPAGTVCEIAGETFLQDTVKDLPNVLRITAPAKVENSVDPAPVYYAYVEPAGAEEENKEPSVLDKAWSTITSVWGKAVSFALSPNLWIIVVTLVPASLAALVVKKYLIKKYKPENFDLSIASLYIGGQPLETENFVNVKYQMSTDPDEADLFEGEKQLIEIWRPKILAFLQTELGNEQLSNFSTAIAQLLTNKAKINELKLLLPPQGVVLIGVDPMGLELSDRQKNQLAAQPDAEADVIRINTLVEKAQVPADQAGKIYQDLYRSDALQSLGESLVQAVDKLVNLFAGSRRGGPQ